MLGIVRRALHGGGGGEVSPVTPLPIVGGRFNDTVRDGKPLSTYSSRVKCCVVKT